MSKHPRIPNTWVKLGRYNHKNMFHMPNGKTESIDGRELPITLCGITSPDYSWKNRDLQYYENVPLTCKRCLSVYNGMSTQNARTFRWWAARRA